MSGHSLIDGGSDREDGVWWAIVAVTTVGYGDTYPETDAGRIIAIIVMFAGIGSWRS